MKVLVHAQHLSGVGHHVRALELARGLAEAHRVVLVDGGRIVPRPGTEGALERLVLPRLARGPEGLASLDAGRDLPDVLAERRERLAGEARRLAPDVLLVEHYPFSKWELEPEITAAIRAARAANPAVRVVGSLRDVCPRTRHEPPRAHAERVLETLRSHFDALLVHGDPAFTRLEEHFPEAPRIPVPVLYTGFVSERARRGAAASEGPPATGGYAVLSVGGGAGSAGVALRCVDAWRRLHRTGRSGGLPLVVFAGLFWSPEEHERVRAATAQGPFVLRPFGPDFLGWLAGARLSISRAGYNTCTNLLETGCPALLVPDPRMSDQALRAARLAELGLADALAADVELDAGALEIALRRAAAPRPRRRLDLDGAPRTRRLLEALVAAGPDLLALAGSRAAPLTDLEEVTSLASPGRGRVAFRLEHADGSRLKGRRLPSAARAASLARMLGSAREGLPALVARRGDALLLEWVEGPTLASLPAVPPHLLRRCGELLARLHGLDAAEAEDDEPGRPEAHLERLERELDLLCRAGTLRAEPARRAREVAAHSRPRKARVGVIHKDFAPENLVLGPLGTPVCIDNASLKRGPLDLAVARTHWRWPMSPAERDHFEAGYEKHRSLATFHAHRPFWVICVLVRSAAWRLRTGVGDPGAPLARLGPLVRREAGP